MRHTTSKRLTGTLYAVGFAITAIAESTLANTFVQDTPLPRLSIAWPSHFESWGTDFHGNNQNGWEDNSAITTFESSHSDDHRFSPTLDLLHLENETDAEDNWPRHLWIELVFDWAENFPSPHGSYADEWYWASIYVADYHPRPGGGGGNFYPTGAAWFHNTEGQLVVQQSWEMAPSPYQESIYLGNIINNAGGQNALVSISAETSPIPGSAAYSLLTLGGLLVARRRRS